MDSQPQALAVHLNTLEGTTLARRFELKRLLGTGGYGAVFEAEQISMGRRCAVKVLVPSLNQNTSLAERFRVEARLTSRLSHPNTVMVYDFGEDPELGVFFMAMEFLEGIDLNTRIIKTGPLSVSQAVHIAAQVAESLEEAHRVGMVHRDVKPHNIMLIRKGFTEDYVKVIDFGIAKAMESGTMTFYELTQTGMMIGTPAYMSPEQILGEELDGRTDQYALAITTYRMLTGRTPFEGGTTFEVANGHVNEAPLPPSAYRKDPALTAGLERVLLKALSKDRQDRFDTALEFGQALMEAHQVSPAASLPPVEDATEVDEVVVARRQFEVTETVPRPPSERSKESPVRWVFMASVLAVLLGSLGMMWKGQSTSEARHDHPNPEPEIVLVAEIVEEVEAAEEVEERESPVIVAAHEVVWDARGRAEEARPKEAEPVQKERLMGRVRVTIIPWGTLYVGGTAYSDRARQEIELPEGRHVLTLRQEQETMARKTVDVRPGSLTMVELVARR
ncbi:MAG: serine/threonine-protein kinase [Bradymonadaceae bacterium]